MDRHCKECKYEELDSLDFPCNECIYNGGEDDMSESKIVTNADRIRSMTDEELAEFLKGIDNGHEIAVGDYFYTKKYAVMMSSEKVLEWLQSDSEV